MSGTKALFFGFVAGLIAALAMTVMMLLLASLGVGTPLAIIGDRLSVFISPGPFLSIMGRVGGYNHLKQLGVGSTMFGQLFVGAFAGAIYGLFMRADPARRARWATVLIFIVLPFVALSIVLWPVLGTNYRGLPINAARLVTLLGFIFSVLVFERTLVGLFELLARRRSSTEELEFSPSMGRRMMIAGTLGLVLAGGAAALMRRLFRIAAFSYDGTQYKGSIVQPITPNDLFYCVTKNVVDPDVDESLWHLEVTGLVQNPAVYRLRDLVAALTVEQETTLMCISNGLDAGLISNAKWKGVPLREVLQQAGPLAGATRVRMHAVDNYTDTIPLEKAMQPTTLIAYEMNGEPLPDRHGFPARMIVPGYFGEKHVKWVTRIELVTDAAKGFYEKQGWGPDFITPTRSRIDVPDQYATFSLAQLKGPIEVKGMAYGGDRGISRVELSFDYGETWDEADIYYKGGDLGWSLWSAHGGWLPDKPGNYSITVRATDGKGNVQSWDEKRGPYSGTVGLHQIDISVKA
jgi:DMSO/TMAO reductase YedYZ molybdopterin-dependent catalytic subunit